MMKTNAKVATLVTVLSATVAAIPALAAEQEAINGCIQRLKAVGGPDGLSSTVLSSEFSEAATLVMLKDAGGTVWKCRAYSDGTVADMAMDQGADDGGGAMAGSPAGGNTATEPVKFASGTTSAKMNGGLTPGDSVRYVLGAKKNQFLDVSIDDPGDGVTYKILNPDGSVLLDETGAFQPYKGQLWQSGKHVVEVINRGQKNTSYTVTFSIK